MQASMARHSRIHQELWLTVATPPHRNPPEKPPRTSKSKHRSLVPDGLLPDRAKAWREDFGSGRGVKGANRGILDHGHVHRKGISTKVWLCQQSDFCCQGDTKRVIVPVTTRIHFYHWLSRSAVLHCHSSRLPTALSLEQFYLSKILGKKPSRSHETFMSPRWIRCYGRSATPCYGVLVLQWMMLRTRRKCNSLVCLVRIKMPPNHRGLGESHSLAGSYRGR